MIMIHKCIYLNVCKMCFDNCLSLCNVYRSVHLTWCLKVSCSTMSMLNEFCGALFVFCRLNCVKIDNSSALILHACLVEFLIIYFGTETWLVWSCRSINYGVFFRKCFKLSCNYMLLYFSTLFLVYCLVF